MQIQVRTTDRMVLAVGTSLGELAGAVIEAIDDQTFSELSALLPQAIGDGGVSISADHTALTLVAPSAAYDAWLTQQQQAAADDQTARNAVVTLVQSCVGLTWPNLTAAQKQSLIVALLYKRGALDKTLTVQPLGHWL